MSLEHPISKHNKNEVVQVENPDQKSLTENGIIIESSPTDGLESRAEVPKIETGAEKVQKLGALDFEAKSIAAGDRRQAEILLTRMKDANYDKALGIHEVLSGREQDARSRLDYAARLERSGGGRHPEEYQEVLKTWQQANKDLTEHEETIVRPVAEDLAREKNPIAHQDPEGKEKKWLTALLAGPLAPLVALMPPSFFRRGSRYKSANPHNQ
jgi:hypothetical protein